MTFACLVRPAVFTVLLLVLSGCVITEQLIPAIIEDRRHKVEVQPESTNGVILNADWYNTYLSVISGLSKEELVKVRDLNRASLLEESSDLNRAKLLVSLMALGNSGVTKHDLSLLGDEYKVVGELTDEWRFFIKTYLNDIKAYQALVGKNNQFVSRERQLERRNAGMKSQLSAERTEREKLEDQLKQLKSIEASLIQRDIREDTPGHE